MLPGLPVQPSNFLNISNLNEPGYYFIGTPTFSTRDVPLTSIFKRSLLNSGENVLLSLFAILAIVLLYAIIQAILLQRRFPSGSTIGAQTSIFLSDLASFNSWSQLRHQGVGRLNKANFRIVAFVGAAAALISLAGGLGLLYLAMPEKVRSSRYDYNLKGRQPVGTTDAISNQIRAVTLIQSCIAPVAIQRRYKWDFVLTGCVQYSSNVALQSVNDLSAQIAVGSWYHHAGSDHVVRFGDGRLSVKLRATIARDGDGKSPWGVLFDDQEDPDMENARYLQDVFIHKAIQATCRQKYAERSCAAIPEEIPTSSVKETRRVLLWRRSDLEPVTRNITGLVTTYNLALSAPFRGLREGLSVFSTSSVVTEVEGIAEYEIINNSNLDNGIEGLIFEDARVCGIVLYSILLLVLVVVLISLVLALRPTSLGQLASKVSNEMVFDSYVLEDRRDDERRVGADAEDSVEDDSSSGSRPLATK